MAFEKLIGPGEFPINAAISQVGEDTFYVRNDVAAYGRVTTSQAHRVVEKGLLAIGGLSQTLSEMEAYSAISGFRDEDLMLFRQKLSFLVDAVSSDSRERSFQRVLVLAGLPQFFSEEGGVNVGKLLRIRESSELREFRDWLSSCGDSTDKEINDRVAGIRAKVGLKATGPFGRSIRFLATTGAGLIPGFVSGLVASALDQFVLDKVLPRSGIAAFVNELYPSIFETKNK